MFLPVLIVSFFAMLVRAGTQSGVPCRDTGLDRFVADTVVAGAVSREAGQRGYQVPRGRRGFGGPGRSSPWGTVSSPATFKA